jgi:hypothetical protein
MKLTRSDKKIILEALKNQDDVNDLVERLTQSLSMSKQYVKKKKSKSTGFEPDWLETCDLCDSSPVVSSTGLCGPCTFGEADTVAGNW